MHTLSKRLRQLRQERGMTQDDLAERLQTTRSTIANWETGRTEPSIEVLQKLTKFFNVSLDYLVSGEEFKRYPVSDEWVFLPVVGEIHAGKPAFVIAESSERVPVEKERVRGGDYFWIRVEGDSMVGAKIEPGDLVLVRRQDCVDNGDIAVVEINDEGAALKRVFYQNGMVVLVSENPRYPPRAVAASEVRIIGKAKLLQKDL